MYFLYNVPLPEILSYLYTFTGMCVKDTYLHHINFTHVAGISLNPIFRKAIPDALTRSSSSIIKF